MTQTPLRDILNSPCNIAYLGNSITAQKNSYCEILHAYLSAQYHEVGPAIKAAIGGVGSLACNFMSDQLVIARKPNICFIECSAADMGGATPTHFIEEAIEGLIKKLLDNNIFVIFLHLFRSTSIYDSCLILNKYQKIINKYQIPSINVFNYINSTYSDNSDKIVKDGIHTTPHGSLVYAKYIIHKIIPLLSSTMLVTQSKPLSLHPFIKTEISLPSKFLPQSFGADRHKLFRLTMPYVETRLEEKIIHSSKDRHMIGFLFVADADCGVVDVTNLNTREVYSIQLADRWCHTPRIQAAYFALPIGPLTTITLAPTLKSSTRHGANGQASDYVQSGRSLKVIGILEYIHNLI